MMEERVDELHRRIGEAETRLEAHSRRQLVITSALGRGDYFYEVESLIRVCFSDLAEKYGPVRKYLKSISKDLRKFWLNSERPSDNDFSSYWIVRLPTFGGSIVGCIGIRSAYGKPMVAEISHLCVSPTCRRRGIGVHLLNHVLRLGNEFGIVEFHVSVMEDSEAAMRLYESVGFVAVSRSSMGQGCCDLVHMVLTPRKESS